MKKKITILDYGMGNLKSVEKAFLYLGYETIVTNEKIEIERAQKIVIPGVGAFAKAMENLKKLNLIDVILKLLKNGTPFLGICLGYQILYQFSEEGNAEGISFLNGRVRKFQRINEIKVPHMGWNKIYTNNSSKLLKNFDRTYVYFVHSYYVENDDNIVAAKSFHGQYFDAAIEKENIMAVQFHPEKSGEVGLEILKVFGGI